jgi:uncharacterized protein with PIN domain
MNKIIVYDCEECSFYITFSKDQDKHVSFKRHELYPEFFKCPDCGSCMTKIEKETKEEHLNEKNKI